MKTLGSVTFLLTLSFCQDGFLNKIQVSWPWEGKQTDTLGLHNSFLDISIASSHSAHKICLAAFMEHGIVRGDRGGGTSGLEELELGTALLTYRYGLEN